MTPQGTRWARERYHEGVTREQQGQGAGGGPGGRTARVLRILVVEDDPIDQMAIKRALGEGGMRADTTVVDTVATGLAALEASAYDCAILDYALPDGTARSLMEQAETEGLAKPPMIVLTGLDDDARAHDLLHSGAQDYLVKGDVSPAALTRAIRYAMDRHAMQRRLLDAETELARLSVIDPLTDLSNRRGLERKLAAVSAQAQRTGLPPVCILIDCDDFKHVNERYGYAAGDGVLTAVASAITTSVRPMDHPARVGGDEFVVLMTEVGMAEAAGVADRIRRAVNTTMLHWGGEQIPFSVSAGVATLPRELTSVSELLTIAEAGLKRSKTAGKNRVTMQDGQAAEVPSAEATLADVIETGRHLDVHRVPVVDLTDGDLAGQELVTRGPVGPYRMPRDLFGAALEMGYLSAADLRCFESCVIWASRHAKQGHTFVNINLFPSTLAESAPRIADMLDPELAPRLVVDLSVQWFTGDPADMVKPVAVLRDRGVRFALDDVGFGRSSLEPLVLLQPEYLKLDGRVVRSTRDDQSLRQLRRMLAVAEALDARVVAEGVATLEEAAELAELGVRYGQGPAFGPIKEGV